MAIKALNTSEVVPFVFDDDPGKGTSDETKFFLRVLPTREFAKLRDMGMSMRRTTAKSKDEDVAADDLEIEISSNDTAIDYVRRGLEGWENFQGADGTPIEFNTKSWFLKGSKPVQAITDELVDQIPHDRIMGLAEEIVRINTVTSKEIKNSGGSDTLTDSLTEETV